MSFDDFISDYQDRVTDVQASSADTFERRLRSFFALLDEEPAVAERVRVLEAMVEFDNWYAAGAAKSTGMVGTGSLDWSPDRQIQLGQTTALFRHFATAEDGYIDFCSGFFDAGPRYDDMVLKIVEELFHSFARDLLKDLKRTVGGNVPAADRVVSIDHNAPQYVEATSQLEKLETAVTQSNEITDPGEKERVVAEISAARRLMKAARVRIAPMRELMVQVFATLKKWVDIGGVIGKLIGFVTAALKFLGIL